MKSPDEHIPAPTNLRDVAPQWTRLKLILTFMGSILFLVLFLLRSWVEISGETASLPNSLGLTWVTDTISIAHETVEVGHWEWPDLPVLSGTLLEGSINGRTLIDMISFSALGLVLSTLLSMTGLVEITRTQYLKRCVQTAAVASVLVYTFHWCGIDPVGLWQSRENAWVHLAGRTFSEEEKMEIREDAERAPGYYAEGEANYIVSAKYKDLPGDEQPSWFDKQQEVKTEKARILEEMTDEEKAEIIEKEYKRLLNRKKGGYWPPEMAPPRLWAYTSALLETIAIAIWASILAVATAIPLSLLAARNTLELMAPGEGFFHRMVRGFGVFIVRRSLDASRGFNELVMALVFVSVIGLGPFAGILALWIHTTGVLGKVFSEAIEAIDPGQVEALVGTGASSSQTISFSVMPQVMPTLISYSLLRFESNVRSAAILGWVGAGGIGFLLQDKMVGYQHREVATMMIMIIMAVSIIDYFCGKLRRRFI